ncbi:15-hydroxyprostaglandin dehydrogenase [NAD(+)] [Armadillidium vulgare]|nr:15-hydroxyprostaglandin dehydrogenase [NAD(+)] [Armadillidium vulgare]
MDFKGKVVLITGGAGGIGKALARTFLEKESKVSICDINEAAGKSVLEELEEDFGKNNVLFSKCDVSKEEQFESEKKTKITL